MSDPLRLAPWKFRPRPLAPKQFERERLLGYLQQHAYAKLVLIHAPAGYGKTTLMTQWHQRLLSAGGKVGWLWIDDDDNDAGRFAAVLCRALLPQSKRGVDLLDAINECLEAHGSFTLFLDEEEHLTAPDAQHLLDVLLDLSPADLHLVVGSRYQPQKIATQLRMRDDLLEVTARDLAFRADEIVVFMQSRCGTTLDAATSQYLAQRTEGWAAALQLAAAEIAQGEPLRAVCDHLATPRSNLLQYLSDEVLVTLAPEQRDFLLQTSLLSELSGPLCDAVTGRTDSEALLVKLQQDNLLLQPIDSSRRRYRYHALFRELLLQQLRRTRGELLPLLARRASEWCRDNGRPELAVEYALLGADSDYLIACIERCMESMISSAQFETAKRWLRAVAAPDLQARPKLLNWSGWVNLWTNDFAASEVAVSELQRLTGKQLLSLKDRLGFAILRVLLHILHARYEEALSTADSAWREVPPDERHILGRLCNLLALLAQMRGQFGVALRYSERAMTFAMQAPPIWLTMVHAVHIRAMGEVSLGNLAGAWHRLQQPERALATGAEQPDSRINPGQLLALLSGVKALVLYELNRVDDAEDCLERYGPFLSSVFSPTSRMLWYQLRARLRALRSDHDGALTVIQEGCDYANRHGIAWMQSAMTWERVTHDLARGDFNHARAIATGLVDELIAGDPPEWIASCDEVFGPTIAAVRFLIDTGDARRALELLQLHRTQSERQLRRLRLTKLLVLEALARDAVGERGDALGTLKRAVELGRQSGAIRTFVDEGSRCCALLRELERAPELEPQYLRAVLVAFEGAEDLSDGTLQPEPPEANVAALSAREAQILQRLAQGHSNLALGQQLFLSPNTVKWHLRQMYAKLGVRNRTEAVHVARQLKLVQMR